VREFSRLTPKIIKQLNGIKYLATIAGALILIIPLVSMLHFWKHFWQDNAPALNGTTFGLWTLAFFLMGLFWYLRSRLIKKADYKPVPKEQKQVIISLIGYTCAFIVVFIYLCVANLSHGSAKVLPYVGIGAIVLALVGNAVGAIYESFARVGLDQVTLAVDESTGEKNPKVRKHTSEAEQILNQHQQTVELGDDEQALQDFFNETEKKDRS